MARPSKKRRICEAPETHGFFPLDGVRSQRSAVVSMTYDEYESIRLIDLEGLSQEECANHMDVARTTAQAIYNSARAKLADCLVNRRELRIEGGNVAVCDGTAACTHCHKESDEVAALKKKNPDSLSE